MKTILKNNLIKFLNTLGIKASESNLTLSHVKAFLQAKWRRFLLNQDFKTILGKDIDSYLGLPVYKKEQIIYRTYSLQNHIQGSVCLSKNMCPCNCTTSEVLLADEACDQKCFTDMLSEYDWEQYKQTNRIYVDLNLSKIIKYAD